MSVGEIPNCNVTEGLARRGLINLGMERVYANNEMKNHSAYYLWISFMVSEYLRKETNMDRYAVIQNRLKHGVNTLALKPEVLKDILQNIFPNLTPTVIQNTINLHMPSREKLLAIMPGYKLEERNVLDKVKRDREEREKRRLEEREKRRQGS